MGEKDTIFERLQLKEGGGITIYADSSSTNHTRAVFTTVIKTSEINIELRPNPESPDVNFEFSLSIVLTESEGGGTWSKDENITIKYNNTCKDCPDEENFKGGTTMNLFITFLKGGYWNVTVYVSDLDQQGIVLYAKSPQLKFIGSGDEIVPQVRFIQSIDSTVSFNAKVGVFKYGSSTEMNLNNIFDIELSIECAVKPCSGFSLTGNTSESTYEGSVVFKNLEIKSGGKFYVKAYCAEHDISGYSKAVQVKNFIKSANITLYETSQSAGFPVNVTATLIGEDDNPYIMNTTASFVTKTSRYLIDYPRRLANFDVITDDGSLGDGIISENIYFKDSGENTVKVICEGKSSNYSDPIDISKSILTMSPLNPIPDNVRREFSFTVVMRDSNNTEKQTFFSTPIEIEVKDKYGDLHNDKLAGSTLEFTNKGIAYFKDLRFKSGGKYRVVAIFGDSTAETELMDIEDASCSVGSGPVASMSVLTFIVLVFPLCLLNSDRKVKVFPPTCCSCLVLHPLTGLFYKQPFSRRSIQLLTLCTSELAMLALIGGLYAYYDTPTSNYDATFEDYYGRQVFKGATGWALAQVIAIPLYFATFYMMEKGNLKNIIIFFSTIVIFLSFGAIVGMTAYYCVGYSIYWTANFLIFLAVDLFVMQTLFSIVAIFFMSHYLKQELSKEGNTGSSTPDSASRIPDDNSDSNEKNHRLYDKV